MQIVTRLAKDSTATNSTHQQAIPYRISIGITGHRQLSQVKLLGEKVKDVLEKEILKIYDPETKKQMKGLEYTQLAFSLLTPLGEGADRLVAHEVLKRLNARIEVVLPLAHEDYLEDFESQESKQEFERLLAKARNPISLRKN